MEYTFWNTHIRSISSTNDMCLSQHVLIAITCEHSQFRKRPTHTFHSTSARSHTHIICVWYHICGQRYNQIALSNHTRRLRGSRRAVWAEVNTKWMTTGTYEQKHSHSIEQRHSHKYVIYYRTLHFSAKLTIYAAYVSVWFWRRIWWRVCVSATCGCVSRVGWFTYCTSHLGSGQQCMIIMGVRSAYASTAKRNYVATALACHALYWAAHFIAKKHTHKIHMRTRLYKHLWKGITFYTNAFHICIDIYAHMNMHIHNTTMRKLWRMNIRYCLDELGFVVRIC